MKNILVSKKAKIGVDILLIAGLLITGIYSKLPYDYTHTWTSPHCISSILWCGLILVHILQHWRVIKTFTRKKVILKNKITALTLCTTFLMAVSILFFITDISTGLIHFHGITGRLFVLIVIIHTLSKIKRFKC